MPQTLTINNQHFQLHSCGALFWEETQMLLIADVHLGKVSHFRKHGSAVPKKAIEKNFSLLTKVIKEYKPAVVCFLGDLFHSVLNIEWDMFASWRLLHMKEKFILIAGNHDIISPVKFEELGIHISKEWEIGNILLTHHPEKREGFFNLCGHIHPGVALQGLGRQALKLPCFFKTKDQMILPAFGQFTGNYILEPAEGDEIYALADHEVVKVTGLIY